MPLMVPASSPTVRTNSKRAPCHLPGSTGLDGQSIFFEESCEEGWMRGSSSRMTRRVLPHLALFPIYRFKQPTSSLRGAKRRSNPSSLTAARIASLRSQ
jgi:hypothetical protein